MNYTVDCFCKGLSVKVPLMTVNIKKTSLKMKNLKITMHVQVVPFDIHRKIL